MRRDTIDRATGRWADILVRLGVDRKYLRNKQGPCPMCGGRDRWRFDNKDGSGSWICNHCGAGYGVQLAMGLTGKDFKTIVDEIDQMDGLEKQEIQPEVDPRIRLRKIAKNCTKDDGFIPS